MNLQPRISTAGGLHRVSGVPEETSLRWGAADHQPIGLSHPANNPSVAGRPKSHSSPTLSR